MKTNTDKIRRLKNITLHSELGNNQLKIKDMKIQGVHSKEFFFVRLLSLSKYQSNKDL